MLLLINEISNNKLINIIDVLNIKTVELDNNIEKKVINGASIENIYNSNEVLFIKNNEAIALYKEKDNKLRSYKMFKGGM